MAKGKTKKELDAARELAYILFINGIPNKEIAERVGVSAQSVTAWIKDGDWKAKKAAKTITRTELINKTLEQISHMLDSDMLKDPKQADKLSKLAALVERLDKKNSPVLSIEVFIQFTSFLQNQAGFDRNISVDFIRQVNKYQDAFITSLMNS
jgi:transposase